MEERNAIDEYIIKFLLVRNMYADRQVTRTRSRRLRRKPRPNRTGAAHASQLWPNSVRPCASNAFLTHRKDGCLGADAKRHAITCRARCHRGLRHKSCSIPKPGVEIGARSQVLQRVDLACQLALLPAHRSSVTCSGRTPSLILPRVQLLDGSRNRRGSRRSASIKTRFAPLAALTSASRKFILGAPMNPATKRWRDSDTARGEIRIAQLSRS